MSFEVRVKPGEVLGGKYRVDHALGAGGMGVVLAATHVTLGQRVALKLMLEAATKDPLQVERFLREARAAARLRSAHSARVLDVDSLPSGEPYIVMELLEGEDLDAVIQAHGALSPSVACAYILQACEAVAEAHGLGIIHRDLKPKNLFLTRSLEGHPLVKVLDFGVAKHVGIAGDAALTSTTEIFGSPFYMSPEQMRSAKGVDARSDVWSLGVCLFELLTGRSPFEASTVAEVCAMVLKDPAPPPSRYAPALSPELDAVVLRCLSKDPDARFPSIAELAHALEPFVGVTGSSERIERVAAGAAEAATRGAALAGALRSLDGNTQTDPTWGAGVTQKRRRRSQLWIAVPVLSAAVGCVVLLVASLSRAPASAGSSAPSLADDLEPTLAVTASAPGAPPAAAYVQEALGAPGAPESPEPLEALQAPEPNIEAPRSASASAPAASALLGPPAEAPRQTPAVKRRPVKAPAPRATTDPGARW